MCALQSKGSNLAVRNVNYYVTNLEVAFEMSRERLRDIVGCGQLDYLIM